MAINIIEKEVSVSTKDLPDEFQISVAIGDGQPGSYAFFLQGDILGSNQAIELRTPEIKGKTLTVSATVTDERTETNWTSVTVTADDLEFGPYSSEVKEQGELAIYTIKLKFK